jgi:uncharacterized protein
MTIALYSIGVVLVVVGLVGLLLPVLPGSPLIFLGLLAVAWADGFTRIRPLELAVLGVLAILVMLVDWVAGLVGARTFGASGLALVGALVGLLCGIPFGLAGLIVGPFLGAAALELLRNRDLRRAGRAGLGTLVGFVAGTVVKCAVAFAMLGLALFFWLS